MRYLGATAVCLLVGGCAGVQGSAGSSTSVARQRASTNTSPLAIAQRSHEYPPVRPPRQRAAGTASSPAGALRAFATKYINWDAQSVVTDLRALARRCVGAARSELEMAAVRAANDYELRRGGIANSGTVESIAPLRSSRTRYVVVTLERTTATDTNAYDGLRPAWHLALATVARQASGWVVSAWQPES